MNPCWDELDLFLFVCTGVENCQHFPRLGRSLRLLIVQCHLVTAHMRRWRNGRGRALARAGHTGCKDSGFTAARRLLYGRWSKMKSDPLCLEMRPLQKNAARLGGWWAVVWAMREEGGFLVQPATNPALAKFSVSDPLTLRDLNLCKRSYKSCHSLLVKVT